MNNNGYQKIIDTIADAVQIKNDFSFSIFEKDHQIKHQQPYMQWDQPIDSFGMNPGDERMTESNLLNHIANSLYNTFYCLGTTSKEGLSNTDLLKDMPSTEDRDEFMETLSEANQTTDGYDPYWSVYSVDAQGNAFVQKNGAYRALTPMGFQMANPADTELKVGTMVHILVKKENKEVQPVFYHCYSQQLMPQEAEFIRFYFNLKPEGAAELVRGITTAFNKYKVPFMFKCLNHPNLFNRADSAVLYLNMAQFRIGIRLLKPILDQLSPHLKKEIPLFTKELRPGFSFAEDPGKGQSFGMSRCTLLAQGIVNAYQKKLESEEDRKKEVIQYFKSKGVPVNRVYLKPNSSFPYDFSIFNQN